MTASAGIAVSWAFATFWSILIGMTTAILPEHTRKILLRILSLVMLMEMLDATVLNTALPQIAISLQVNPIKLKEILTIYFLSLGVFIPVSGWVADRFGEKNAMLFAITLFTVSSIGCGLSVDLPMLIAFRLFQGIGGAFLMPIGRQIVVRVFPIRLDRVQAMAKINVISLLGLSLGPVIGGALTTYANWRWIFFVNIPVGFLGFYLIYRFLPIIREKETNPFDLFGFILLGSFLGILLFLLDVAIDPSISIHIKLLLLAVAIFSLFIYIQHAKSAVMPLISLNLFKQGRFKSAALGSFLARLTLTTHPFLIPLLLQAYYGYSALESGLLTVPVIISTLLAMFCLPFFIKHFDSQKLLIINTLLLAIVFASFYWQTIALMIPLLVCQQLIMGFLTPVQQSIMNTQAYEDLSQPYVSQGVSFYSIIIQVSGSFGIALAALVMTTVMGSVHLEQHIPLIAFKVVFIVQSIYLLLALWIFKR